MSTFGSVPGGVYGMDEVQCRVSEAQCIVSTVSILPYVSVFTELTQLGFESRALNLGSTV